MVKVLSIDDYEKVLGATDRALCQIEWDASNRGDDDNKTDQTFVIERLKESYKILTGEKWESKYIGTFE